MLKNNLLILVTYKTLPGKGQYRLNPKPVKFENYGLQTDPGTDQNDQ
ncbi:hypothetical protein GCM10027051_00490 [Niabella terrae]